MKLASVGLTPATSSSPNSAPRNVASSMNAVAVELSSAPGYDHEIGEADAVVAIRREGDRDDDTEQTVGEAAEDGTEPVAGPEEQVHLRRRMDVQDGDGDREPDAVPARAGGEPAAVRRRASPRSTRPSRTSRRRAGA